VNIVVADQNAGYSITHSGDSLPERRHRLSPDDARTIAAILTDCGFDRSEVVHVKGYGVVNAVIGQNPYIIATLEKWQKVRERHGIRELGPTEAGDA
jgi:hypothetical protein